MTTITIPLDVAEAAAEALGNFVSDHGWSDSDMQAMDNLDAYIARHRANQAARAKLAKPTLAPAWHDAPNELGRWTTAAGKATDIRVDGAVMLDREMREWTQARQMYLYWSIAGWHVMIGRHFCTLSCNSPEDAILDAWNSGEYDDLEKCAAIAKTEGEKS